LKYILDILWTVAGESFLCTVSVWNSSVEYKVANAIG